MTKNKGFISLVIAFFWAINFIWAQPPDEAFTVMLKSGSKTLSPSTNRSADLVNFQRTELIGGFYYRYLQFHSIPDQATKSRMEDAGIELLNYIPNKTYLTALPADLPAAFLQDLQIRAIAPIAAKDKMTPELLEQVEEHRATGQSTISLNLQFQQNIQEALARHLLARRNIEISESYPTIQTFVIFLSLDLIEEVANLPFVQYLEWAGPLAETEDNIGRNLHRSNLMLSDFKGGQQYDGAGVHLAIGDDGFIGPHIDFNGRTNQEAVLGDMDGDHGEIVAGILTGAGNLNPLHRGMAPAAFLHVVNGFDAVKRQRDRGLSEEVVITSTSYGDGCNRGYTVFSQYADQQTRETTPLIHVFSAGNTGEEDCGYGAGAGWGTITGGIKAGKNVLAVANLNKEDERVASSSRGPSRDGRIKPDISANGSGQISTAPHNTYIESNGSSAAAPGVAGVLAQVYQAYRQQNDGLNPNSALIKAAVLNTAEDLGNPGPDFSYGWGRINAHRAWKLLEEHRYERGLIQQSKINEHQILLTEKVSAVRVMCYWHDKEASPSSARALVNDLDMTVTRPNGRIHEPLVLNHQADPVYLDAPAKEGEDHLNNVEQVLIKNPSIGILTINVHGHEVPEGPQEYFLVYEIFREAVQVTHPIGGERFVPGEQMTINWDAYGQTDLFQLEYSANGGQDWLSIGEATANQRKMDWIIPEEATGDALIRISRAGFTDSSDAPFNICHIPTNLKIQKVCQDFTRLSWNSVEGASDYIIYQMGEKFMDSIIRVTNTVVEVPIKSPNIENWFAVSAIGQNGAVSRRTIAISNGTSLFDCTINHDISVLNISEPSQTHLQHCFDTGLPVSVNIRNSGNFLQDSFVIRYQLNDEPVVTEYYNQSIPSGITINYPFEQSLNPGISGRHSLKVWTEMAVDEAAYNDTSIVQFYLSESEIISIPYYQDFDEFVACVSAEDCIVNCPLENGWTNAINKLSDQIDWRINQGETPTSGTGPNQDQNTSLEEEGKYIYVEGSGACHDKLAELLSPCFDLSDINHPIFSFWYHLRGEHVGRLHVDLFDGAKWHLNIMAPLTGHQSDNWRNARVNLSAFSNQLINIRFRVETGESYLSDMAIDNISIFDLESPPIAAFRVDKSATCPGNVVRFSDNSHHAPTEFLWEFTPNTVDFMEGTSATDKNPVVRFNYTGYYSVKLKSSNPYGSNSTESVPGFIRISDGKPIPVLEDFNDPQVYPPKSWSIHNPDDNTSWTAIAVTGINDQPSQAVYVNNHSYNAIGQVDELRSFTIDLHDADHPFIRFDLSYAQYSKDYSDGLRIELSQDCGENFTEVLYDKQGFNLATVNDQTNGWRPDKGNDWRTEKIDLSAFVGHSVVLKFINICGFGNNLYLDNVLIYENGSIPNAQIDVSAPLGSNCLKEQIVFKNMAVNAQEVDYQWSFGIHAIPTEAMGEGPHAVVFSQIGQHNITLTAGNATATTVSNALINIKSSPLADFDFAETEDGEIHFTSLSEEAGGNSYQWDFGDGTQSAEAHPVHSYTRTGWYPVQLKVSNECGDNSIEKEIQVITTSLHPPNTDQAIRLFPNPALQYAEIELKGLDNQRLELQVFTLTGQLLQEKQLEVFGSVYHHPLDLTMLPKGTYLIQLKHEQFSKSFKLLIL